MDTFSFTRIQDAKQCEHGAEECGNVTRIRIDGVPCCEQHMHHQLRVNARSRMAVVARTERDRRRAIRRIAEECLLCASSAHHEHKRIREQRQKVEDRRCGG